MLGDFVSEADGVLVRRMIRRRPRRAEDGDLTVATVRRENLEGVSQLTKGPAENLEIAAGGAVVTATPDYGNYLRNLTISLFNRWDHHHSALWDGGHIKFFSRATLQRLFAEQGFSSFQWDSVRSVRAPIFPMSLVCIARLEAARP